MKTPDFGFKELAELLFGEGCLMRGGLTDSGVFVAALNHIRASRATIRRLRQNLSFKRDELSQRNATMAELYKELEEWKARVAIQGNEISRLQDELRKYQPPSPKFRVNQVCICDPPGAQRPFAVKVDQVAFLKFSNAWSYTDTCRRTWEEHYLRALSDEEK